MAAPRKPAAKSVSAPASAEPVVDTPDVETPAVAEEPVPAATAAEFAPVVDTAGITAPEPAPEPVAVAKLPEEAVLAPSVPVAVAAVAETPVLAPVVTPIGELQEMFRAAVESNIEQSKAAYARLKSSAEEATDTIETAYKTASAGSIELNNKAIELMRDNTNALFDFAKSLTAAKSLSDIVVLQTEHARKQFETLNAQAKEISGLVQKIATESAGPLNAAVAKGLRLAA